MNFVRKGQEESELRASQKKTAGKFGVVLATAGAAALAMPSYAFASEEGGMSAILPNMDEFIPMLVAFIILWVVLAKFGWPMFEGMLEKRQTTIRDDLKKAEDARQESERLLAEYKQQLAESKAEAARIVADAKKAGEDVKADITAKANKEAADMIEKAHAAIEAEKKAAAAELRDSVAEISVAVAAKLIGNDLSDDEHRKMIKRYVEEAGSFNAN